MSECMSVSDLWYMIQKQMVLFSYYTDPCISAISSAINLGVRDTDKQDGVKIGDTHLLKII